MKIETEDGGRSARIILEDGSVLQVVEVEPGKVDLFANRSKTGHPVAYLQVAARACNCIRLASTKDTL